ncbi:16S rRNA (cytidine(1402)-2'-O)-methyltransferase [Nesterenkonia sp. NBAIMH1]|uniref:16S rRNA (cytidine(1402)-2'-O)-methyltransferase n=1 Tax=Nesterenkonia sp. NBAIMH1 TaxID=2600320 RepID=UPI001AEF691D|nr:16S rRNA (cytidine(1402)-2'-O)-methyltransferase [Nesterenkonia sp. NBAIMH1]
MSIAPADPGHTDPDDQLWDTPVVLAATPIGNLSDTTDRLRELIRTAEVIACEDTRRTRHLISGLGLSTRAKLVSLHEHNEAARSEELVRQAGEGVRILVVSDAGMPAVSDPGFRLIAAAVEADVAFTVAPGASAVTTALALSGLATDAFTFGGFIPRRESQRQRLFDRLRSEEWTTVLFESPHRISRSVDALAQALGRERRAAVARELTKRYEEVLRGTLGELSRELEERQSAGGIKGEMVLVLAGAAPGDDGSAQLTEAEQVEALASVVLRRCEEGTRLKDAAKQVAAEQPAGEHRISSRDLYQAVLQRREATEQ